MQIWDARSGEMIHRLVGHEGEISCSQFEFTGDFCATGSIDKYFLSEIEHVSCGTSGQANA
jgi:WD40 repeat protein